jgi:hypothetical protein
MTISFNIDMLGAVDHNPSDVGLFEKWFECGQWCFLHVHSLSASGAVLMFVAIATNGQIVVGGGLPENG